MLVIRSKQLKVFQPKAEAIFLVKLVDHIQKNFPNSIVNLREGCFLVRDISDEKISELVERGIKRARRHHISWESALTFFVTLMFLVAPNFDEETSIQKVLKNGIKPNEQLMAIFENTTEENWQMAEQNYDEAAWE